ncbi:Zinc finger protein [Dissostichus eleginoides]|uniref:Zinc finger protein n=1 Tax=Dissostichus eleginoides TaxID=100907 RepID=A0AAD9F5V1_DISEL|nr:Zinc finger protein [Dissostichus eleginoides]
MGICGPAQALKAKRPGVKAVRWDSVVQGSGLSTGGRLPDSRKHGPDGVGWGGKGPGEESWTAAQCGDCLSAQALGHAATPPWARAPALGFQRDVTGGTGFPSPLQDACPTNFSNAPPKNSFQPPLSPSPQMPLQQLFCFSHELRLPLTLCHSHHCCLTFGRRRGRLCCYTAPICPMSFHAVDHDAAAWLSGRRKDFGKSSTEIPPLLVSRHSRSQPPCLGRVEWLGLGGMALPPSLSQATATTPAHNTFLQPLTSPPSNQERDLKYSQIILGNEFLCIFSTKVQFNDSLFSGSLMLNKVLMDP